MTRISRGAIKIPIPDVTQLTGYSCGAACLLGIAHYYGVFMGEEDEIVRALTMDRRVGAHPEVICKLAKKFGLETYRPPKLGLDHLRFLLNKKRPVMMAIQAYGDRKQQLNNYQDGWTDGHWIVAIGHDETGIFFEDPSLQAVRGYLPDDEIMCRWHDVGAGGRHFQRIAIVFRMKGDRGKDMYAQQAQVIP